MESTYEENVFEFRHLTKYRVIAPPGADRRTPRPIFLALHGMGMNVPKFQRILRHLEVSEMLLVIPEGMYPYEMRQKEEIEVGYGWYIYRGDQDEFYEHLETSEGHVLGLLDRIEEDYAVDRRRSVVLGFSQGGYLAGFMALRQPHRFGGLVIASSRLKHEFLEDELASGQLPATLFLHSEKDKAVAWDRTLEGKELLEKAGAPVHYYLHEDGHRLPPDAVVRVAEWLGVRGFDRGRKAAAEIAQAWKALERNDPAKALELVKERLSDPEEIEARLIAGAASIEMEQFKEGADYLEQLGTLSIDGDTDFVRRSHLGQAYYYLGRPQDALFAFDPLEPADPYEKASLEWWKGLCLDHLGKTVRADDHFKKAQDLDPEGAPSPINISIDEVESIIQEVSHELPARLQEIFEEVPVVVQDLPPRDVIRTSEGRLHPDTLGLYSGSSLIDQSVFNTAEFPATIYIYRRNLERFATTPEDLREQVRITLLHELGHHLGFDEDGLDELGLA